MIEQLGWSVNSLNNSPCALCALVSFSQLAEVVLAELGLTSDIFVQVCQSPNNVTKKIDEIFNIGNLNTECNLLDFHERISNFGTASAKQCHLLFDFRL